MWLGKPTLAALVACTLACGTPAAHTPAPAAAPVLRALPPAARPFVRTYALCERIAYRMHGVNDGRAYDATVRGVVKQGADGAFYEELAWSDLVVNGAPVTLTDEQLALRQRLSLATEFPNAIPDLRSANPRMIGPMLDLLAFYADGQLFARHPEVARVGDHAHVAYGKPASWANPAFGIVVGEDAIDIDLAVTAFDDGRHELSLLVQHVPPPELAVRLPAEWMQTAITPGPPNWVQVARGHAGGYEAAVGRETFDVALTVDASTGRVLTAVMTNPVEAVGRTCSDAELAQCEPPEPHHIMRRIELTAL